MNCVYSFVEVIIAQKCKKIKKNSKKSQKNLKKVLIFSSVCDIIYKSARAAMERWLSWSKAHDWKSCLGLYPNEGSNPSLSANKNRTFVYRQMFCFCLSKPQVWHIITARSVVYIITRQRVFSLRLDDIQCFALMIYRNKLRMIYTASP